MAKVSVKLEKNRIPDIARLLPRTSDKLARDTANQIMQYAMQECPVDTGNLREGHDIQRIDGGYEVFNDVDYAGYVHFGTSRQAANPWLMRALRMAQSDWQGRVAELRREIEQG